MKKVFYKVAFIATLILSLLSCDSDDQLTVDHFSKALAALDWGEGTTTYVVGHKSPDTDAVCSAITYAYLMNALGYSCEPRVAGKLNNETKMVLKRFGIAEPKLLENAEGERIIMTDHSELLQAVAGMDKAKVLQIIDHHGLGSVTSSSPLFCRIMPLGSSCTVVYTSFKDYGVTISREMAGLILSALLSDTNNMTSTTVTAVDSLMYAELLPLTGIAERIIDITATGTTLRENNLVIVDEVCASTARFFANVCSFRTDSRVAQLAQNMSETIGEATVIAGSSN